MESKSWFDIALDWESLTQEELREINAPTPMDLKKLMTTSQLVKQAYLTAEHLGYSNEQTLLSIILYQAGHIEKITREKLGKSLDKVEQIL